MRQTPRRSRACSTTRIRGSGNPMSLYITLLCTGAWPDRRARSGSRAKNDRDIGLWRVSRCPAGGSSHDTVWPLRDSADRRQCQREGVSTLCSFCYGQIRLAWSSQSTARELGPKGIHIAHFVIDGGVRNARRPDPADRPDSTLDPDGIAQTYLGVLRQPRSAWSLEVELRPWVETF